MLTNKNILITGATGSFGKQAIRSILAQYTPNRLIVFSRDELKQFEMQQEFNHPCMRYFLGDVRDRNRLMRAFEDIDIVIHAAALKQVPALEYNPGEAVETNIRGAENIIHAAIERGVKKVIALSTDKAVSPINLYGATKLVSDKLFVAANNMRGDKKTAFSIVRYGNVLGSRGSVIPFFQKLLAEGAREIPITDPRMTRFWITLPQSVEFVLRSLARMQGGETFTPKIPSMNIMDLADVMAPELEKKIVGIRPGEKLHEVLCPAELAHDILEFPDHFIIQPAFTFTRRPDYRVNPEGEHGKSVADGFEYNSFNNPELLSKTQLSVLLAS